MTQVEKAPRPGLLGTLHSPALQWGGALDLRASLRVLHPSLDDGNRVLNLSLSLSLPEHFGEPSGHLTIVCVARPRDMCNHLQRSDSRVWAQTHCTLAM